jgi:glutamate-1-semialdehyde 2,1-aminomutase
MNMTMQPSFLRSSLHQRRAAEIIPGGAHTYAKGDDQYPENMAPVISHGRGCRVWDLDGNEFIEFGAGLRAVGLGHGWESVCAAAAEEMRRGTNFARPSKLELTAAEALLSVLPNAEMVKFAKNGSDATTAAVKLARAYTGRDMVAICSDHPFYSIDDWFIGFTPMNSGIPRPIGELTVGFRYNDLDSLRALFEQHPGRIACVMMEVETTDPPRDGFLQSVRELAHQHGALFILDETITGFRFHLHGGQALHRIDPDLSTFGKAIANGFAVSALVGKREFMRLGGLDHHDRDRVFLLSTTHGADSHSLAAMIENIRVYREHDVIGGFERRGTKLKTALNELARSLGIHEHFFVAGRPGNLIYFTLDERRQRSQPFRTLFLQETLRRGLIAPNLVLNHSHSDADIDQAVDAIAGALEVYRRALDDGIERYLVGRPVKPVFRKRN